MSETFRSMGCEVVVDGATAEEAASVRALFERRDATFSRFRTGSELNRVNASPASPLLVSAEFARLVRVALGAASATSGAVTPTVGAAVVAAGYDRDLAELVPDDRPPDVAGVPPWRRVGVSGRWLTREGVVTLDLNGVVKGRRSTTRTHCSPAAARCRPAATSPRPSRSTSSSRAAGRSPATAAASRRAAPTAGAGGAAASSSTTSSIL
jgi:thiamine biosynthesis lipoprotein